MGVDGGVQWIEVTERETPVFGRTEFGVRAAPRISRPNSCRALARSRKKGIGMMAAQDVFVRIDVSKDRLDVYVRPLGGGFSVSNEAAGYAAVTSRLQPLRTKRIVLEATDGYERALWLAR
jgi:transposase